MSLTLTPAILEATYELLRTAPPFNKWKLPHADSVEFHVKTLPSDRVADYWYNKCLSDPPNIHIIRICAVSHPTIFAVLESMAHEIVHLHQRTNLDHAVKRRSAAHGAKFKRLAAQVCKRLGFNPETF